MLEYNSSYRGFTPIFQSGKWLVAVNSYNNGVNDVLSVRALSKHLKTDEVFILLAGKCSLLTAGKEEIPGELKCKSLESGKIYVVERNEWHVAVFEEGGQVVIIENSDSTPQDHETIEVNNAAIQKMYP